MSVLKDILYGLISGFSEFLPVSSLAHQSLLMRLFGWDSREPVRDLAVHMAMLLALLTCCGSSFSRLSRERRLSARRRRGKTDMTKDTYDLRLVRNAAVPLALGLLFYLKTASFEQSLLWISLFLCINGIIMILPDHMHGSNKDSRAMSSIDSLLVGVFGALSVFPGVSRVGTMSAYASIRGAGKQHALNWALLLSLPALILLCGIDIVNLFSYSGRTISLIAIIGYILSALFAYIGSYLSIVLIRFLIVRTGYSSFAYYSWGAALFSMILYLIT